VQVVVVVVVVLAVVHQAADATESWTRPFIKRVTRLSSLSPR
jgi:hypothetical protein